VAEPVDAADLKSVGRKAVRVRVPPSPPIKAVAQRQELYRAGETTTTTTTNTVKAVPVSISQAKQRFMDAGYTQVTALLKGPDGVWHAKAMKDGQPYDLALDLKGNITAT
jgi:YbbR domain-containing protein